MDQTLYLIGLNHRSAEVDIREKFALAEPIPAVQKLLASTSAIREALVLSTCNRVEFLAVGRTSEDVTGRIVDIWSGICGQPPELLTSKVYAHKGLDAVTHVFTVAASLDSMVMGEPQILGQMKDAYRAAVTGGTAKVIVNRLLHKSFSVAKRVRTETGIGSCAVSISYAAVELAKKIFGSLSDKSVMLVGAGEMAELAATHLLNAGVSNISVANRTFERGQELATRFHGRAVHFYELFDALNETDIVITSTGSPQVIIRAKDMKPVLKKRKQRPMFFIDIAVPRDVDPDVNSLDNVFLYDIDDLKDVVEENMAQRREEAQKARAIVEEEVHKFGIWLKSLELTPTITDLLEQGEAVAQRELKRSFKQLGVHDTPETREVLERLALSLSRKIFHEPIVFLKRRSLEEDSARQFIHLTRRLFNLDAEDIPTDAHSLRKRKS